MTLASARTAVSSLLIATVVSGCIEPASQQMPTPEVPVHSIIPLPASIEVVLADTFTVTPETLIVFDEGDAEAERIGLFLAGLIGNTLENIPEVLSIEGPAPEQSIYLSTGIRASRGSGWSDGSRTSGLSGAAFTHVPGGMPGSEAYQLDVSSSTVSVTAETPAGLFYGVQTLRQLMPSKIEYTAAFGRPLPIVGVHIVDEPRYEWRGAMLDVSRHFFTAVEVKGFIDLMALYKMNRLHLHLTDDQGWRIEIPGWPNLTDHGGSSEVGGGEGGFYTVEDYVDLVAYAADRFVMVIPEIDMPGHTNAALASYAQLNCDGRARDLFHGIRVGFSTLCAGSEVTYDFIDDVVRAIAAITPGPYFHMGGDEVEALSEEEYAEFTNRVQDIVEAHGKELVGWDEVALVDLRPGSIIQLWRPFWTEAAVTLADPSDPGLDSAAFVADSAHVALVLKFQEAVQASVARGAKVILSPADRLYLDMKYDSNTPIGLAWAGLVTSKTAYDWRVSEIFEIIPEKAIAGVEAPFWSETLGTMDDIEQMAFPRLPGVAELGWTPGAQRKWSEYRLRLQAHEARWIALGVNYHRGVLPN